MLNKRFLFGFLGVLFLFLSWELLSFLVGNFIIPQPVDVILNTMKLLLKSSSWLDISITLLRIIIGFSLAFIMGIITGILAGLFEAFDFFIRPIVSFFQGLPPIMWAIPLILILGTGGITPMVVISIICYPLIVINIIEGVKSEPVELKYMLRIFAPGFRARIVELLFPYLKPFIEASGRTAIILGIKASVVAEFFGANNGIGFRVEGAYQAFKVRELFSWALFLIVFILLIDRFLISFDNVLKVSRLIFARHRKLSCTHEDIIKLKKTFICESSDTGQTLILEDICFGYKKLLLSNINLTVAKNEIAVITGDSGVGKTTLLRLITGELKPIRGKIQVPLPIGVVFQDDRFLPWKNILDNTAIPLYYAGFDKKASQCFSQYLLSEVGLMGNEFKYPSELSGGMKKRAALARCFARIPNAILLDEPFTGLHENARKLLWDKLYGLLSMRNIPVVVVTHFPEEVPVSDRLNRCTFYRLKGSPASIETI